jgi:hypothetical protein
MATATATIDPNLSRHKQALSKLGRFCMDNLPDSARNEFIALYDQVWTAWLDTVESDVRVLQEKNELVARLKSRTPFLLRPDQRN